MSRKTPKASRKRASDTSSLSGLIGVYMTRLANSCGLTFDDEEVMFDEDTSIGTPDPNANRARDARRIYGSETALLAMMLARAVDARPGLSEDLSVAAPVIVVIDVGTRDAEQVKNVVKRCVLPEKTDYQGGGLSAIGRPSAAVFVHDDDASRFSRKSFAGDTLQAIRRGQCVICVSSNARALPEHVRSFATHTIRLPDADSGSIEYLARLAFGARPSVRLDGDVARRVTPLALAITWRRAKDVDDAVRQLNERFASSAATATSGPRLSSLPGYGEAKVWGMELAADLQAMRAGTLTWADIDHKGLLLSGPPGTGKTTFAKAVANEAGVPLIATSVAEWTRADHLGVTQEKMRKAFADAMAQAPCILFIDELDGISNRSTLPSQHATYWTQVVNALLEHLAGVEDRDGVVVLGASNHPDRIDPAVRRSGRLDRHIEIPMPDLPALEQILRYHLKGDLADTDLRGFTMSLVGQSGADVEALVRRARGKARRSGGPLTRDVLVEVRGDGQEKVDGSFRRRIAVHEAGHVVAARWFGYPVTCMAMTVDGGIAMTGAQFDGRSTARDVEKLIVLALAGRAAEEVVHGAGEPSAGGESDLEKATELALLVETRLGGGIYGPLHLGSAPPSTLLMMAEIRHAVAKRLTDCHERAVALVRDSLPGLQALVEALLADGYLGPEAIEEILVRSRFRRSTIRPRPNHAGGGHVA
jgi:hypothetical protein